jgi:hypothetical protein
MTMLRRLSLLVVAVGLLVQVDPVSYVMKGSWTSSAQAIVGAPATPVSVAGVARRTTRRCAAGVYHC